MMDTTMAHPHTPEPFLDIESVDYTNLPEFDQIPKKELQGTAWGMPTNLVNDGYWAYQLTKHILQCTGSIPSDTQEKVLMWVNRLFFAMATEYLPADHKRVVVPLPTGYGKSTSVAAFIVALHRANITGISVAVSSSRVEDLSKLKRDLVKFGGPDILAKVGFLHSYKYDEAVVKRSRELGVQLPGGYASEPAILDNPDQKQFILLTHARVRNSTTDEQLAKWNTYRGKDRSIVIYDESLLPADVTSFALDDLASEIAYLSQQRTLINSRKELIIWLEDAHKALAVARDTPPHEAPKEGVVVQLPNLTEEELVVLEGQIPPGKVPTESMQACLRSAGGKVRVHPGYLGMVANFEVRVNPKLKRVVVLDASYPIRMLAQHTSTVAIWDLPGKYQQLKALVGEDGQGMKYYPDLTLKVMQGPWGRGSIQKDLDDAEKVSTRPKFVSDIVRTVQSIPEDEAVLIFGYKDKGKFSQTTTLRNALEDAGINLNATLADGKRRVNIATWGQETGANGWSHCSHVILAGVMQLASHQLFGGYLAAQDDLQADYDTSMQHELTVSESAHLIYQAISRGTCRMSKLGYVQDVGAATVGKKMTAYMVVPRNMQKDLKSLMDRVMPGATWAKWDGDFSTKKEPGKIEAAAEVVKAHLEGLRAEGVKKVSSRALKAAMPEEVRTMPPMTWTHTMQAITEDGGSPWEIEGRSLVCRERADWGFEE